MKFFKEFIYPVLVLGGICLIVAVALSQTFKVADPIIKEQQIKQDNAAREDVLSGSTSFEEVILDTPIDGIESIHKSNNGYAILANSKGFGGKIYVMVGIDNEGNLAGVKLTKHNETPGLGTKVGLKDFTSRFLGKNQLDVQDVDTISGATVSSKAFKKAVDTAYMALEQAKGGK